jgi:hypothetical protein
VTDFVARCDLLSYHMALPGAKLLFVLRLRVEASCSGFVFGQ